MKYGYSRPAEGTVTRKVWDIASEETKRRGRLADRKSVLERAMAQGVNYNTASTQYHHWRKSEEMKAASPSPASSVEHRIVKLELKEAGRVLLPAEIRVAMGLSEGQTLVGELFDGELRLMSQATAVRKAQALVRRYVPEGVSLVDELLADRRAEVRREDSETRTREQ